MTRPLHHLIVGDLSLRCSWETLLMFADHGRARAVGRGCPWLRSWIPRCSILKSRFWFNLIHLLSSAAGRVQSVALRLVAERESEIQAFNPQRYWTVVATLQTASGAELQVRQPHHQSGGTSRCCWHTDCLKQSCGGGSRLASTAHCLCTVHMRQKEIQVSNQVSRQVGFVSRQTGQTLSDTAGAARS